MLFYIKRHLWLEIMVTVLLASLGLRAMHSGILEGLVANCVHDSTAKRAILWRVSPQIRQEQKQLYEVNG